MTYPAHNDPLTMILSEDVDFFCLLKHILHQEGFHSALANGVDSAIELADGLSLNALVLDCRSSPVSASTICSDLRVTETFHGTPMIVLMSSGSEREQVRLMDLGVEESLTQPLFPQKLIEALHKITGKARPRNSASLFKFADVEMDVENYWVRRGHRDVHLGPIEFRMLQHFLRHPDQVFSRKELVEAAWDKDTPDGSRAVDVHMGKLRKALSVDGERGLFRTVRGVGYALSPRKGGSNDRN